MDIQDNFKELFIVFRLTYEGISGKELKYNEFIDIFPKLKLFLRYQPAWGYDLIKIINQLLYFKENNLLDQINEDSVMLIRNIYFGQYFKFGKTILSQEHILKHLLLPYNVNRCEDEFDTYEQMSSFEAFFTLLAGYIDVNDCLIIKKYNIELYKLLMHFYSCVENTKEKQSRLICSSISHIFGVFYFNQNQYDNDYCLLDQMVENILKNEGEYMEYCKQYGIKELLYSPKEYNETYSGIIKYMNESYQQKKIKRK